MKLYWDIQNHEFVMGLTDSQTLQRLDWILRDQVPVELYIVTPNTSQGYTQQEAPSGYTIRCGVKASGSFSGNPLATNYTWTLVGSGATAYYTGTVNLNTSELIAVVEAESQTEDYLDLVAEFCFQDGSGNNRDSSQLTCRVTKDINRTGQAEPAPYNTFPYVEFTHSGKKCIRIQNSDGEILAVFTPPGVTYP